MAESVVNLREENKQLRKAHHDIHVQLQDAQVRKTLDISYFSSSCMSAQIYFFLSCHKCEWLLGSLLSDLLVQIHHQDLKAAHDHLALTLEDHKSALAAAQVRVQPPGLLQSLSTAAD